MALEEKISLLEQSRREGRRIRSVQSGVENFDLPGVWEALTEGFRDFDGLGIYSASRGSLDEEACFRLEWREIPDRQKSVTFFFRKGTWETSILHVSGTQRRGLYVRTADGGMCWVYDLAGVPEARNRIAKALGVYFTMEERHDNQG